MPSPKQFSLHKQQVVGCTCNLFFRPMTWQLMHFMHAVGCLCSVIGAVTPRECRAVRMIVLIGKLVQLPLKHLMVLSAANDFSSMCQALR